MPKFTVTKTFEQVFEIECDGTEEAIWKAIDTSKPEKEPTWICTCVVDENDEIVLEF